MSNNLVENIKSQNLALKLKLSPTQEQKSFLDKSFGCARFIYNFYLNEKNQFYEKNVKGIEDKKARNAASLSKYLVEGLNNEAIQSI